MSDGISELTTCLLDMLVSVVADRQPKDRMGLQVAAKQLALIGFGHGRQCSHNIFPSNLFLHSASTAMPEICIYVKQQSRQAHHCWLFGPLYVQCQLTLLILSAYEPWSSPSCSMIWAMDGPQGLQAHGASMGCCWGLKLLQEHLHLVPLAGHPPGHPRSL